MRTVLTAASMLAAMATPAFAHHSGAMFDRSAEKTITGTVRAFNWTNPHASFAVTVAEPSGAATLWQVEMNSPNNLVPAGWKRSTLKVGDKISAVIHPLRDGRPGGSYVAVVLADGTKLGEEGK